MTPIIEGAASSGWYQGGAVVVLLPERERDHWHGHYTLASKGQDYAFTAPDGRRFRFFRDEAERKRTHYFGALDGLSGTCATVGAGQSDALIIDGEVERAKWLAMAGQSGGVWAALAYAPSEVEAESALERLPTDGWETLLTADLAGGRYCIQDAIRHGREPGVQRLSVELRAGTYTVSHSDFGRDTATRWYLHRLKLTDG